MDIAWDPGEEATAFLAAPQLLLLFDPPPRAWAKEACFECWLNVTRAAAAWLSTGVLQCGMGRSPPAFKKFLCAGSFAGGFHDFPPPPPGPHHATKYQPLVSNAPEIVVTFTKHLRDDSPKSTPEGKWWHLWNKLRVSACLGGEAVARSPVNFHVVSSGDVW